MKATDLNDDPFAYVDAWPLLAGQTTDATKKHHKWLGVLVKEICTLRDKCAAFEQLNGQLAYKVTSLEKENGELKKSVNDKHKGSWASLVSTKDGKRSDEQTKFLASMAKESRVVAKLEYNMVVNGLPVPTTTDEEEAELSDNQKEYNAIERERLQLEKLLYELGCSISDVATFKRLKPSNKAPASASKSATSTTTTTTTSATAAKRTRPYPIIVRFRTCQLRDKALQAASELKETDFNRVYLDIDKTQAERAEEFRLRQVRNAENAKLPNEVEGSGGRHRYGVDQESKRKFYYAIRSGSVVKVYFE